ncbi:hypothetical protein QP162_00925 [Sphingomonas aurantiaca]|uniref:hypothetical protein n=1 Tax=Sphingomonas aurantiaca TaxID=185949 RepID=UPI002FE0F261
MTSVTVMPATPIVVSASRTSSSLNGLMMAMTSFIAPLPQLSWEPHRNVRASFGAEGGRRSEGEQRAIWG